MVFIYLLMIVWSSIFLLKHILEYFDIDKSFLLATYTLIISAIFLSVAHFSLIIDYEQLERKYQLIISEK